MTLFLVELSPEVAGHLAVAIELYRRELEKAGGWAGPEDLATLGGIVQKNAYRRQDATPVALLVDAIQGAHMPLLLSTTTAAQFLGVSKRTVERLVADGQLVAVSVGGRTLIRRVDLERYVDSLCPRPFREQAVTKKVR